MKRKVDVAVIGGGPAGLSAAISAARHGAKALIIERNESLGGILNQCIHEGFGIELFKEALTGPEYMQRYIGEAEEAGVEYLSGSMVLSLSEERKLTVASPEGLMEIEAKAVVLAMGCRERTRGNICIPGERPAGVYTAGCAQNLINLKNYMVGKRVVILGSGDIGLIMARRLTLEGAKVLCVAEILPHPSGLPRNIIQCLEDYDIPLYTSHTVTEISGARRVESVTIAQVDEYWKPMEGTEKHFECDTILLSVGLIPENELSMMAGVERNPVTAGPVVDEDLQTSIPGIFACGNVLHVHDIVDYVTLEAELAGKSAAEHALGKKHEASRIGVSPGEGIRYVLPNRVSGSEDATLSMRVLSPVRDKRIVVRCADRIIKDIPKKRLVPSEMQRVKLRGEEIWGADELIVELR